MDAKLKELIATGVRTKEIPSTISSRTDSTTIQAAQVRAEINFANMIGGVPDLIQLRSALPATFEYRRNPEDVYRRYFRGLPAGVQLNIEGEGWTEIRVTPAVFPYTLDFYVSRAVGADAAEVTLKGR